MAELVSCGKDNGRVRELCERLNGPHSQTHLLLGLLQEKKLPAVGEISREIGINVGQSQ